MNKKVQPVTLLIMGKEYESALDESLLTGESKPIDKKIGDRLV